jgi:hypothetical protein
MPQRSSKAAEAVVDTQGDHIHVLADPAVERSDKTRIGSRERIICVAHKQMVVFNTGGPVRCEAILPSNTHGATPAGGACRGQFKASGGIEDAKAGVCHRRAALEVKQRGVPCITDLASEKADATGFGASVFDRPISAITNLGQRRTIATMFWCSRTARALLYPPAMILQWQRPSGFIEPCLPSEGPTTPPIMKIRSDACAPIVTTSRNPMRRHETCWRARPAWPLPYLLGACS